MARALTIVEPAVVRAMIARLWLGREGDDGRIVSPFRGRIELRPHQLSAVRRLRRLLQEHGGALLADDVGLGKTYVAATIAREYAQVLVVAPATLRAMWLDALRATRATGTVVSYASLSRGGGPAGPFDLVLLDEAHYARTPATRRYARIAALADGAHVLLLSATPIHNSRADLAALLALFLGARAWMLDDDALARHVVRRERGDLPFERIPDASAPMELAVGDDEALLRAIIALPPPLPPRGAGAGGALLAWGLVREWASSNGALAGALRRRLVRANALDAAIAAGCLPSRGELGAWACGDHAVQLAFPELLDVPPAANPAKLRSVLGQHERAVRALLELANESAWTDVRRAQLLREVRERHRGEKIVAFTQFADTARALFRHLGRDAGVAVLTARGASVAGGALSRQEAVERFAPRASGVAPPREIERIELLLATDLLSEGVNLHDASVVVHLDVPWTPARLEQRVGRSRRLGALHAHTIVYAIQPPASSEALLRVEARLRAKLSAAHHVLGVADCIIPALVAGRARGDSGTEISAATSGGGDRRAREAAGSNTGERVEKGAARRSELIVREIDRWRSAATGDLMLPPLHQQARLAAFSRAPCPGMLALVRESHEYRLIAARGNAELDEDPAIVLRIVRAAGGGPARLDERACNELALAATARVERWTARRTAALASGSLLPVHTSARRQALRRVAAIAARAPHHRRAEVARLAAMARRAAAAPYGIGAEWLLADLVAAEMGGGEEWLRALGDFAAARGGVPGTAGGGTAGEPLVEPVAILVLCDE